MNSCICSLNFVNGLEIVQKSKTPSWWILPELPNPRRKLKFSFAVSDSIDILNNTGTEIDFAQTIFVKRPIQKFGILLTNGNNRLCRRRLGYEVPKRLKNIEWWIRWTWLLKTSQLTKWNASAEGCGVRADESFSSLKKNNKFFPTYEAHQYVNEGRIWFQKNPIRRWDTSQRELWEILASTLWMVSKQSRMGIWRNNTKWLNLLSGVLPSVLKLQGFQCSFHPNQIRPSSSSYKTCFTGQGFSTGQFHRHWWFVAVEIHGNQNKAYIIAEQRAGDDCKRTFPSHTWKPVACSI